MGDRAVVVVAQALERRREGGVDASVELAVREHFEACRESGDGIFQLSGGSGLVRIHPLAFGQNLAILGDGRLFHHILLDRILAEAFKGPAHGADLVAALDARHADRLVASDQAIHLVRQLHQRTGQPAGSIEADEAHDEDDDEGRDEGGSGESSGGRQNVVFSLADGEDVGLAEQGQRPPDIEHGTVADIGEGGAVGALGCRLPQGGRQIGHDRRALAARPDLAIGGQNHRIADGAVEGLRRDDGVEPAGGYPNDDGAAPLDLSPIAEGQRLGEKGRMVAILGFIGNDRRLGDGLDRRILRAGDQIGERGIVRIVDVLKEFAPLRHGEIDRAVGADHVDVRDLRVSPGRQHRAVKLAVLHGIEQARILAVESRASLRRIGRATEGLDHRLTLVEKDGRDRRNHIGKGVVLSDFRQRLTGAKHVGAQGIGANIGDHVEPHLARLDEALPADDIARYTDGRSCEQCGPDNEGCKLGFDRQGRKRKTRQSSALHKHD